MVQEIMMALVSKRYYQGVKDNGSPKKIFGLTKSSDTSLALAPMDYCGDIKFPKATALLEDQNRGNGVKKDGKKKFPESIKTLSAYDLFLGNLLFLGKTAATPRLKVNPFAKFDDVTGKLVLDKQSIKTAEKLEDLLKGKLDRK